MMSPLFYKFSDLAEFKDLDFYTCDTEEQDDVQTECAIRVVRRHLGSCRNDVLITSSVFLDALIHGIPQGREARRDDWKLS
jgi:hypothetical protein